MTEFGPELRRVRLAASLSQRELAHRVGVTQGYVSSLESGRNRTVSVSLLFRLSEALEVPADHWRPYLPAEVSTTV